MPFSTLAVATMGRRSAEAADRKLNQVYQQVREKSRGTQLDKLLVGAEVGWIEYRDASYKFAASRHEGGLIAPTVYNICLEILTKQRTQELETYLQESS